jgi:hypothetical protein
LRGNVLITAISAAAGACFAGLAGMSISAAVVQVRGELRVGSIVIALASLVFGYLAFRAALGAATDDDTLVIALRRGMLGALLAAILMAILIYGFGTSTRAFFAHGLGKGILGFTNFRLLLSAVLLGFGAGFVFRMPRQRA